MTLTMPTYSYSTNEEDYNGEYSDRKEAAQEGLAENEEGKEAMKDIAVIIHGVAIITVVLALAFLVGRSTGKYEIRQEAVEHHKAEYMTNESGQQVWRWLQ